MKKRTIIIGLAGVFIIGSLIAIIALRGDKPTTSVSKLEVTLTPADLAKESQIVLTGRFISSNVREVFEKDTGEKMIYTDWQVEPQEVWKGTASKKLIVSILGGENGNLVVIADTQGGQNLKPGDERLLYLYYRDDLQAYTPLSTMQAIFTALPGNIFRDEAGTEYAKTKLTNEIEKVQ
ncbi:MAG: hypothetical protein WC497_02570 [Patescibacteria group bacterium]